eukprot:scaffold60986_cov41-Prasinocladus_malaysianus.AAC.2
MAALASEKDPSSMTGRVFQLSMVKTIDLVLHQPREYLKDTIANLQEYHNNTTARTAGGKSLPACKSDLQIVEDIQIDIARAKYPSSWFYGSNATATLSKVSTPRPARLP